MTRLPEAPPFSSSADTGRNWFYWGHGENWTGLVMGTWDFKFRPWNPGSGREGRKVEGRGGEGSGRVGGEGAGHPRSSHGEPRRKGLLKNEQSPCYSDYYYRYL